MPAVSVASPAASKSEKPGNRRIGGRRLDEGRPFLLARQRHLDRRDVRVAGQAIADVRQLLVHQHERHVHPLDLRAHRPVEHRHQLGRGLQAEAAGLAGREDVRRLVDDQREAEAIALRRHDVAADEAVEHGEGGRRILRQRAQVADLAIGERHHVLEALLLVAAGEGAQPLPEIVVQHQRPAAEHLLREELGEHAVAGALAGADPKQVVGIAVQDERRGRAGEIEIGQLRRPGRKPVGQLVGRTTGRGIGCHAFSAVRRSASRIAGGSSS